MADNMKSISGGGSGPTGDLTGVVTNIISLLQQAGVTNLDTNRITQAWTQFYNAAGPAAPLFVIFFAQSLGYQVTNGTLARAA